MGQVVQDLSEISFRKNVAIDMDLDATLIKLTLGLKKKNKKATSIKLQAASLTEGPGSCRMSYERKNYV